MKYIWLVVYLPDPSEKYDFVSWDDENIKVMFQTTNQILYILDLRRIMFLINLSFHTQMFVA